MALGPRHFDAVERLAVLAVGLASDGAGNPGAGHQIPFIGPIDEHLAGERAAAFHADRNNPRPLLFHAGLQIQPLAVNHLHMRLGAHLIVHLLSNMRLKSELRIRINVMLALGVLLGGLLLPRRIVLIMGLDAGIKLAGDAADRRLIAHIGRAKPAGGHAAQVPSRLDQHNAFAHAPRLHGGDHTAAGPAVYNDVIGLSFGAREEREDRQDKRCKPNKGVRSKTLLA